MGSLRSRLIRLAYARPDLRKPILARLKMGGSPEEVLMEAQAMFLWLRELEGSLSREFDLYRLTPTFKPDFDLIDRAMKGAHVVRAQRQILANLVELFPTNNDYVKAYLEASRIDNSLAEHLEKMKVAVKSR